MRWFLARACPPLTGSWWAIPRARAARRTSSDEASRVAWTGHDLDLSAAPQRRPLVVLVRAPDGLLRRRVVPRAALPHLGRALQLELAGDWPLRDDPPVIDWSVERVEGPRVAVVIGIVRQSLIAAVHAAAQRQGAVLGGIDIDAGAGPSGLELLPKAMRPPERPLVGRVALGLASLGLAVMLAGSMVHWAVREQHASRLREDIAQLREAAAPTVDLRARHAEVRRQLASVADARQRLPAAAPLLVALTRALPDGTWLVGLHVQDGRLTLVGESDAASSLIGALDALPGWRGVRFAGPVTRNERRGTDRFEIILDQRLPDGVAA